MTKAEFYADLNPRCPRKGEGSWRVFVAYDVAGGKRDSTIVEAAGSFARWAYAEAYAKQLGAAFDELDGIFVEVKV
jgi:hypothetical protein